MRLKGRQPHEKWPVPYPHQCPKGTQKCPTREINDVENYLLDLITSRNPLLHENNILYGQEKSYTETHVYVHEPDPEDEKDFRRVEPAVWVPPQVSP